MEEKTVTLKLRDLVMGGLALALCLFFALELIGIRAGLQTVKVVVTTEQNERNIRALDQAFAGLEKRVQELEKAK